MPYFWWKVSCLTVDFSIIKIFYMNINFRLECKKLINESVTFKMTHYAFVNNGQIPCVMIMIILSLTLIDKCKMCHFECHGLKCKAVQKVRQSFLPLLKNIFYVTKLIFLLPLVHDWKRIIGETLGATILPTTKKISEAWLNENKT